ncbi:hypothetical protein CBS101457_005709 [Exobasidium rhododendri]|nr:hypothetical protein CBS101457_005709 [Exobasidium rhododendri]
MKATPIAFGIKGIFPLIKKHAPGCITPLATLDALPKSTRLAIDATLLIQRLHFADDAHPSRHILGFHRLIRQMREASLIPIMVFDNFSKGARLKAKGRENEKRRLKRSTLTLRADIERLRGKRLEALAEVMKEWRETDSQDRVKAAAFLRSWQRDEELRRPKKGSDHLFTYDDYEEAINLEMEDTSKVALDVSRDPSSDVAPLEYPDPDDFFIDLLSREDLGPYMPRVVPRTITNDDVWSSVQEAEASAVLHMASKIHHLRRQYGSILNSQRAIVIDLDGGKTQNVPPETPTQTQMTLAEGSVYGRLQAGLSDLAVDVDSLVGTSQAEAASLNRQPDLVEETMEEGKEEEEELVALTAKNILMQRSYARSSTPLSKSIFESCATLCSLLKVPVLWTGDGSKTGGRPHEAEALASMLVRKKLADAVVSEDSDVLLYGVPLIRGIMGHKGLEYIDSMKARYSLFPPSTEVTPEEGEAVSLKQMLDFALLCGTDFNRTVPGIGSVTALKLIREYKSIDGIRLESMQRQRAGRSEKAASDLKLKSLKEKDHKVMKKSSKELAFPMPDNLKWREYSKELREARKVFENPPSLYWEARKLRSIEQEDPIDYQALNEFLQKNGINSREMLHEGQAQHQRRAMSGPPADGFGGSPFGDGKGSAATWGA